uniref:ORF4 n=1 Tax=Rodent Torque teno virus 1 TaxID=1514664 RepID=X2GD05_9VIRU|nr:ORF4 [Rodent Torque teno virus 1]AHN14903.1 ORF4 [Rodent Torque teno virus 1]AHN14911.1 ORF4 [Rodent Torque teno virus 1]
MVASPGAPMQYEWPEDGEYSEEAWERITRPLEEVPQTFAHFQATKKTKKKTHHERKKKKIHKRKTSRHQLDGLLGILNRLLCVQQQ